MSTIDSYLYEFHKVGIPSIIKKSRLIESPTDEKIARAFHDYIVKLLYYDFDSLTDRKPQDALAVLANEMAVCEGYSTLYAALLRASGIETQVYTGSNHAWNMVYWSGSWHDIDTTWDDPLWHVGGTCDPETGEYCCNDYPDDFVNSSHVFFHDNKFDY